MDEQELIARCHRHAIPYAALPLSARRELAYLVARADDGEHGVTFLLEYLACHAADCHVTSDAVSALQDAVADLLARISERVTVFLSSLGDMGHSVSFALSRAKLTAETKAELSALKETLGTEERALGLITRQLYSESTAMSLWEPCCMNCRITDQLIVYAAVLSEWQDERLTGALCERERVLDSCRERRAAIRKQLEEVLGLCEETVPAMLTEFREQSSEPSDCTLPVIIRLCESLRTRTNSLHSLLISKIRS